MSSLRIAGIESAKLKLARVAVHLDEIRHLISESTRKTDAYEIIKDANGKETVNFLLGPPQDLFVIVGEIVYQFRSALDHLAFQLIESNQAQIALPGDWERHCKFPLMLNVPATGNPPVPFILPVPQSVFEKTLPGMSKTAYAFIESVQPYHRGPGIHNVLRIIGQLANIDRHKHFHVMIPRLAVHSYVAYSGGITGTHTVGGLKHGAEVPLFPAFPNIQEGTAVNVYRTFSPYVTFDAETIGVGPDTLESENVLEVCLQQFESVIIPTFDKLLQNS